MISKSFKNMEELSDYFESEEGLIENSKAIFETISHCYSTRKKIAQVCSLDLDDENIEFTVKINESEWVKALEHCLLVFERNDAQDESIDTYLLIRKLKKAKQ